MTKINKKFLVFLGVLVCSLCLCLGIAACSSGGTHTHTFGGFWLTDGAEGHYQLATCHPEVKSELKDHYDEDEDGICDVCGYVMHTHVDEDEDGICDECQTEIHKHEFETEWTFNENKHWHEATCEHFIERSDYADHSFVAGICKCGVKESEVKVYALYKDSPEYDLYFTQWLAWLADNDIVEVEYTETGDGIYHYADGTFEVRFLGGRTVKVKAVSDSNEPLAHVWFMVTLYYNGSYYEYNGSIALGLAETDNDGIAEIAFRPIAGYSSETVIYQARLAEAKDIAGFLGIDEEDAKPIPNRYEVLGATGSSQIEVGEGAITGIISEFSFQFSRGWNAYDKIVLPYARYYTKPLDDTSEIKEENLTYTFTTSGDNLFDYMYFIPANNYSFAAANPTTPPDQLLIIEQNFAKSASGIYKLHFEVEGDATAQLYYWNENGVNLSAYHETNKDGTPAGKYITSLSGGTAGTVATGGNFVNVEISPDYGLRYFQLGLKTDAVCTVTITVERTGDFIVKKDEFVVDWSEAVDGVYTSSENVSTSADKTKTIALNGVPAGLYEITLDNNEYNKVVIPGVLEYDVYYGAKNVLALIAYTDTDPNNKITVYEGTSASSTGGQNYAGTDYRCVIRITEDTQKLYFDCKIGVSGILIIKPYELPTLTEDEPVYLPVTNSSAQSYAVPLDGSLSGEYNISVIVCGTDNVYAPVTVNIGGRVVTLKARKYYNDFYYNEGTLTFESGDSSITFTNGVANSYMANVTLTKAA